MPGLSFDDSPTPDPQTPLSRWLDEWVEAIARHSRPTVAGYVSDVAGLGAELAGVVGKQLPDGLDDRRFLAARAAAPDVARMAARFGFRPGSYMRARDVFAVLALSDLHPKHLARAVNRYAGTHQPASTRRAAAAWSSFCRYLVGQQILAGSPMDSPAVALPRRPEEDPAPLASLEVERVFEICGEADPGARHPWPARDLAAAALFVATGVRLEEAIAAVVGDFFDEAEVGTRLRVLGKGGKTRTIPVHPEAALAVRAYLHDRTERFGTPQAEDPLLVRADGSRFSPRAMRRLVERWYTRAGVRRHPGAAVHALRHTFGTQALDSGASIVEVQQLMGHRSLETTKRYLDVVGGGLEDAVAHHRSRELLRRAQGGRRAPHDPLGSLPRDSNDQLS